MEAYFSLCFTERAQQNAPLQNLKAFPAGFCYQCEHLGGGGGGGHKNGVLEGHFQTRFNHFCDKNQCNPARCFGKHG